MLLVNLSLDDLRFVYSLLDDPFSYAERNTVERPPNWPEGQPWTEDEERREGILNQLETAHPELMRKDR